LPNIRKNGFRSSFEHAVWMINSQEQYVGNPNIVIKSKIFNFQKQEEMMNVMSYNIGQKKTEHPTEKPLNLTGRFINIFTNKGDVVLDPFLGSGTTAAAAQTLHRNFIGIEIDPKFCEMARQRLRQHPLPF